MIKLAVISTDEASEERLLNCLRSEKDFIVHGFIVIRNTVHELDKGLAFINKMAESPVDIIIVDGKILREAAALSLPPILDYTKKCAFTRAIIIGDRFIEENLIVMMKEGARGFLLREHVDADIIKCIRVVARGEIWMSTHLIGRVFDELFRRDCEQKHLLKSPNSHQLAKMKTVSRRELEVMALISESMTNEEIAQKLFLSAKTVKTHIRNIFEKTGIRNRVEAVLLYIRYKQENERL
jgi:DNA-binding NarL/FixJ family response regulator